MTVHVTWWWAAWAGSIIYGLGVLAGWAMLRIADDVWWRDRLLILGWPLILLWRIVMFILVIDR